MNNQDTELLIKRLSFENILWGIYLIIAIFNIYGDELIKKSIRENIEEANQAARKIFLYILIVTLLINIYFIMRNYYDYQKDPNNSTKIRLIGSCLLIGATLCFLYSQLATQQETESVSNV